MGGGEVACVGKSEMHTEFLSQNMKGRNDFESLGVSASIILNWILEICDDKL
jgi:hypothetical protein